MSALYRNRNTGIVFSHPRSGIGEALHSDEVEVTGKPVDASKPRVRLGSSKSDVAKARKSQSPKSSANVSAPTKTTDSNPAVGDSKQEGAH
jgi:hypothetical protein